MFKKMLQGIKQWLFVSAETAEMVRYLNGARTPQELEERIRTWERNAQRRNGLVCHCK